MSNTSNISNVLEKIDFNNLSDLDQSLMIKKQLEKKLQDINEVIERNRS